MKRMWYGLAIMMALMAGGLGYHYGTEGGNPPPGTANVYLQVSGGNDSAPNCQRYSPAVEDPGGTVCATMTRAITLAQPGDIIQLRAGSYGSLTINRQSGSDSPKVTIRGDPNLPDQFGCIESEANFTSGSPACAHGNVLITGLTICGHGIKAENLDTTGLTTTFYVGAGSCTGSPAQVDYNYNIEIANSRFTYQSTLRGHDLVLSHSAIGPNEEICTPSHNPADGDNLHIWPSDETTRKSPYNITLDHDLFYDASLGNNSGSIVMPGCNWGTHTDLVQTLGYDNLVVTHSIFWGAVHGVWQDGTYNGSTIGNGYFYDNFIAPGGHQGGNGTWQVGEAHGFGCDNGPYVYDGNTFAMSGTPNLAWCNDANAAASVVRNNYFQYRNSCAGGPSMGTPQYSYNAFATSSPTTCGTNTQVCNPSFLYTPTDSANDSGVIESAFTHGWDLHIASGDSCLKDHADQSLFQSNDIDGQARSAGTVDIGADEVGG